MKTMLIGLLLLALAGCEGPPVQRWQGYVEGEYVYLASPTAGYLQQLLVKRGGHVQRDQPLYRLSAVPEQTGLSEATAREQAAQFRADNLQAPQRGEAIRSLQAQVQAAQAALGLSESRLRKQQQLAAAGFISNLALDEARASRDRDAAQLRSLQAQLTQAQQEVGRQHEVGAAQAEVRASEALRQQRQWLLAQSQRQASATGIISETFYREGEWVPAGQPVASLLPDDGRLLRFFVPETQLASLKPGGRVRAQCDGCGAPFEAEIRFIATQPEYTPPILYNLENRSKLVFRVEAVPLTATVAQRLLPGMPLDVTPVGR